jgi:signal transduction histidine kinase/DNA-binding response OmpR family regulator
VFFRDTFKSRIFGLFLAGALAFVFCTLFMMRQISQDAQTLENFKENMNYQMLLTDARNEFDSVRYWTTQYSLSLLMFDKRQSEDAKARVDAGLAELSKFDPNLADELRGYSDRFFDGMTSATSAYIRDQRVLGNALVARTRQAADSYVSLIRTVLEAQSSAVSLESDEAIAMANLRVSQLTVVSIVLPFATVLAALMLMRSVTNPISRITSTLRDLRTGKRDVAVPEYGAEELHEMSKAVENLRDTLIERDQLLSDLDEAREAAEAGSRAKSRFLAMMSHEIRTPLNGVMGLAELMLREGGLEKEHERRIRLISRSGLILRSLVDDVIDLSRVERGKLTFLNAPYNPSELLHEVVSMIGTTAENKKLKINLDIEDTIPDWLDGDVTRIRQILFNLAGNAVKFTEKGEVSISINRSQEQGFVEYRVRDTGPGMTEEELKIAFEPMFTGASSAASQLGSSGLGLSIARELARAMGGDIVASSAVRVGSEFAAKLPLVEVEKQPVIFDKSTGATPFMSMKILLVEDDPTNQEVAMGLLGVDGHEVTLAETGEDAVERAMTDDFDIVLMDIRLPGIDGIEATRQIRELEKETGRDAVPILALTASVTRDDKALCMSAGMQNVLRKPLSASELSQELGFYMDRQQADGPADGSGETDMLLELKKMFPREKFKELADTFVANLANSNADLETSVKKLDWKTAKDICHRLAGACASFGHDTLAQSYRVIEEQIEKGDYPSTADVEVVRQMSERVSQETLSFTH